MGQYVFTSKDPGPLNLRRVHSVPDLFQAFSDGGWPLEKLTVAIFAILGGNLVAKREWGSFMFFGVAGLAAATWEYRVGFASVTGLLVLRFLETFVFGQVSLRWALVVVFAMLGCLVIMYIILWAVQEDSRNYVMLKEGSDDEVVIVNRCCMDVKLLVFDRTDTVRLIPYGGLLGGCLLQRDASLRLGDKTAYIVKAYAPFELELGTFVVDCGLNVLRQTAPPLHLFPCDDGDTPSVSNASEGAVRISVCPVGCWTEDLWLPMAPVLARLRWGSRLLNPNSEEAIQPPCIVRVYRPRPWPRQLAYCLVRAGESAEYSGSPLTWRKASGTFRRSLPSSQFRDVH